MKKIVTLLLWCFGMLLFGACDVSPPPPPAQLRGVNLPGGDVEWGTKDTASTCEGRVGWKCAKDITNPISGQTYLFVSHQDIDYLAAKGVNFVRLVFSWELTQPVLNGPLTSTGGTGTYMSTFVDRVNYATSKGVYVLIEPHGAGDANFIRYKGNLVGSPEVPYTAFADFWGRMATQFKANPKVLYGLGNEPHDMSTMQWYGGAQAAITAIRNAGATTQIFVPGNGWSQPSSWNDTWVDTAATKVSNATGWSTLKDPANNLVVSVHTYFDQNGGGGADDVAGPDIIATRLKPVLDWARAKGLKVHLSEFGAKSDAAGSQVAVTNALKFMELNKDTIIGWSWWAYGPPVWWGGYRFTLDPTSNYTVDDPKMAWLKPYFVGGSTPVVDAGAPDTYVPPPPVASPTKPTAPIAYTPDTVFTTVSSGKTNWAFVPKTYDGTHNTPMTLFVWLHGCGGQSQWDAHMVSFMPNQNWISLAPGGRETTCWSNTATDGPMILAAIAELRTHFNIDPKRIILGGYSSGGDVGYPLLFQNASMFAGGLFQNTAPNGTAITASGTASWKINITHVAHTGDTTYPIAAARTWVTTLKNKGFPVTLIEKAGTHYDNDNGTFGTAYDLRTFLLPIIQTGGWVAGGVASPVDAGTPPPPATCVYSYGAWGVCQVNGTQARTVTGSSPTPCTATTQVLSQRCTFVPPTCSYTYGAWGACQPGGTQTRTVAATTPTPCTATTQLLSQTCTYVYVDTDGDGIYDNEDMCPTVKGIKTTDGTSNGCLPLIVTAVKTYAWDVGYCKQYYFKNPNPVPMNWKTMKIYLKDGKLRGADSVWGAIFADPLATGTVVVKPSGNTRVDPGQNSMTVGFCANYGPSRYVGSNGGLTY